MVGVTTLKIRAAFCVDILTGLIKTAKQMKACYWQGSGTTLITIKYFKIVFDLYPHRGFAPILYTNDTPKMPYPLVHGIV